MELGTEEEIAGFYVNAVLPAFERLKTEFLAKHGWVSEITVQDEKVSMDLYADATLRMTYAVWLQGGWLPLAQTRYFDEADGTCLRSDALADDLEGHDVTRQDIVDEFWAVFSRMAVAGGQEALW